MTWFTAQSWGEGVEGNCQQIANSIQDAYRLSPLQQGMLFNTLSDPGSGVDVEQVLCELHEVLDVAAFQRAWRRIIARHSALRTSLRWEILSEPRQEVHAEVEIPWEEQDWREITGNDREERIAKFLNADRRRGFELTLAPLFRLTLLCHGAGDFHLIWTIHHTILDGQSFALILLEVFAFYEAFREGRQISLPLPRPFRDYIDWLQQQDFNRDEPFWRETLKGFTAPTPLIVDHAPGVPQINQFRKGAHETRLSAQVTSALRELARDHQLTFNTIVQGAWALLLNRYSGEDEVVFGVIRTNRRSTIEGADTMVGLFVNTLPLRVPVDPETSLIPWLKEVRQQWTTMRDHAHTPLASIQAWSDVPSGSPLFHSTVMFENDDLDTILRKQGGAWSNRRIRTFSQTNYPLDLAAYGGTELRLRIDFDRNQIDETAAGRMLDHVRTLLCAMASNPQSRLRDLPLLTEIERHQLLVEWNDTAIDYPTESLLHEFFEEQATRTPNEIKVVYEGQHLTNGELEGRANQLAHFLQKHGVGPDTLVAIRVERSLEMVVGMLGILKAGGAYVPLEPDLPSDRVAHILNDTRSPVLLTQDRFRGQLPLDSARVIYLDTDWADIARQPPFRASSRTTANDLAYVIYTSGSTGRPKGVMISHAAICNHMHWMKREHRLSAGETELQKAPFGFDASLWEFFAPLMTDAHLVMARPDGHLDPAYLAETIQTHRVSTLQVVPSQLRMLLDEPTFWNCGLSLKRVYCGGEPLTKELCDTFNARLPNARLYNMYGPTEGAIDSTYWLCPRANVPAEVPIGRPIGNVRVYIVNPQMQLMPIGVPGELLVGGAGLARGYLNDPKLTAERFLADPFLMERGARVYRTGDLARFLPDGNIEFLGRFDHQVKIRGFRIELGEIEAGIAEHPAVREAVVMAQEFASEDVRLVAYVVTDNPPADLSDRLHAHIRTKVPEHMVPAYFVVLDALPLTPAGKIDRKQLLIPHHSSLGQPTYVAPRTPTEEALATTWRKVLQLEHIGVRDNFFDLGGHSLLLARLVSKVNVVHRVKLGVPDLVQNPTIEQVARLIDEKQPTDAQLSSVVPLREGRSGIPVYFIYAGRAEFDIARRTEGNHPVFGIEVRWPLAWRSALSDNRTSEFPSMEQMVAPYVAAIRAHSRSTPCVLVGLSYAGRIAFEAAHQLQKQAGNVARVILIDSQVRPPDPYQLARQIWLQDWTQPARGSSTGGILPELGSRLRSSWHTTSWLLGKAAKMFAARLRSCLHRLEPDLDTLTGVLDAQGMPMPWGLLDRLYGEIDKTYSLHGLEGRGILFRTTEVDGKLAYAPNEALGWEDLFSQGLEIVQIPGEHYSIWGEQIPTIAREMDRVLRQCAQGQHDKAGIDVSRIPRST